MRLLAQVKYKVMVQDVGTVCQSEWSIKLFSSGGTWELSPKHNMPRYQAHKLARNDFLFWLVLEKFCNIILLLNYFFFFHNHENRVKYFINHIVSNKMNLNLREISLEGLIDFRQQQTKLCLIKRLFPDSEKPDVINLWLLFPFIAPWL